MSIVVVDYSKIYTKVWPECFQALAVAMIINIRIGIQILFFFFFFLRERLCQTLCQLYWKRSRRLIKSERQAHITVSASTSAPHAEMYFLLSPVLQRSQREQGAKLLCIMPAVPRFHSISPTQQPISYIRMYRYKYDPCNTPLPTEALNIFR